MNTLLEDSPIPHVGDLSNSQSLMHWGGECFLTQFTGRVASIQKQNTRMD